ncbi:hypothetical protein ACGC1H_000053 [Rhizoctonia solani]
MSVRALPAVPQSTIVRPLPSLPSQASLASGSTATVRALPAVPNMSATSLASVDPLADDASQLESEPNQSTSSRPSPLSRLHKKKRHLKSVDSFAVPLPPGVDFQMIPQHHLQTQHPQSPTQPPTPNKPPRLNLGLFSSRARKESSTATGPSTPGLTSGSEASEDPLTLRKRGSTTAISRSPSPGPGAVGMRKAASATETKSAPPLPPKPAKLKAHAQGLFNSAIGIGMSLGTRGSVMPTSP